MPVKLNMRVALAGQILYYTVRSGLRGCSKGFLLVPAQRLSLGFRVISLGAVLLWFVSGLGCYFTYDVVVIGSTSFHQVEKRHLQP